MSELTLWDRIVAWFSPAAGLQRLRERAAARVFTRNYEAASPSRRTNNWPKRRGDINTVTATATSELRIQTRDLIRNNAWARRGQNVVANNTVGWGIVPKSNSKSAAVNTKAMELWKLWADSTECESERRHTFYGLQHQVMKSAFADGEVLVRRRWRKPGDGLTVPMQLQILEADFLDSAKNEDKRPGQNQIVQGVEFNGIGQRVAYWLFPEHPGSSTRIGLESARVPAEDVSHVLLPERPGQVRGISWLGTAIVNLRDFDEFEDAELMRQKIAACFAVFKTDPDGQGTQTGAEVEGSPELDQLEPGMIYSMRDGEQISFANPPGTTSDTFAPRQLRRIAAAIGVSYEDLTGDYSHVNFSSARMGRLTHQGYLKVWQYQMLIPLFCSIAWRWFAEAAEQAGLLSEVPGADWTVPPLPMIEPDKEGLAYSRLVRNGVMTFSDMVREQGGDPEQHWAEYAEDLKRLDEKKIKLDADVRAVSQAGLTQERAGVGGEAPSEPPAKEPPKPAPKRDEEGELLARIREFRRSLA